MTTVDVGAVSSSFNGTTSNGASSPGSSSNNKEMSSVLPPCRVCGERASGFHYGANTCEACKGFFRRSLQRKEEYKCSGDGTCTIVPGKRHVCAACRYQKCLNVGMSKNAIKTGRYTHEKKTRDIEEVKRLELQAKMKREGKILLTPEEREKELERIIKHITTVHLQQTPHTPEFFEKLPEREAKFLERRALQEEMFGTMKPLSREEYRQIYQSTGIDIDGRREMITHMIPSIEKAIKRFIAFAKALPGFKDLPIDDQIALIKGSATEVFILDRHMAYDLDKGLYYSMTADYIIDYYNALKFMDVDLMRLVANVVRKLQKLKLSPEEHAMVKAILLFAPDRFMILEDQQEVDMSHESLADALQQLTLKQNPDDPFRFCNIIAVLTEMRTMTKHHDVMLEAISDDFDEFPTFMVEFCYSV